MKRVRMTILMIMLIIGMVLVIGSVGNLEFADLTHTQGFTEGQFWLRCVIGFILMITAVVEGNRID